MLLEFGAFSVLFGVILALVGQAWLTVLGFKKHILWGLLNLVFPFIYPFYDWKKAAISTYVTIAGILLIVIGMAIVWNSPEFQAQLQQALDVVNQQ